MLGSRYGYFNTNDPYEIYLIEWVVQSVIECWDKFSLFDWYKTKHTPEEVKEVANTWARFTSSLE